MLWIVNHPNICSHRNEFTSCGACEHYTKAILQEFAHRAILVVYQQEILGHIKLSGYKTFLSYQTIRSWKLKRWWVYNINSKFEKYMITSKAEDNLPFDVNKLAQIELRKSEPLGLLFSRMINASNYAKVKTPSMEENPEYDNKIINDNFAEDLRTFQERIDLGAVPALDIPLKSLHPVANTLRYFWLTIKRS